MILAFDFSKICTQGAYFSSFIACSLQDYLQQPIIPEASRYHAVGCSPSLLKVLAMIDTMQIVQKYRQIFAERQTIIDLLLPYYDACDCKYYLGRFIIFRGQLLGIRLNTAKNIFFNSWTRQKTKIAPLKDNQSQTNILVGEFCLNLPSIRIGLLFDDQVMERGNQYMNHCFDVIILTSQQSQDDIRLQSKINEISMRSLLIQVKSKEKYQYLQMRHLKYLNEGSIHFLQKNKIKIAYYTIDKIYATKLRLKPNQKTLSALQIDLELLQPEGSLDSQANMYPHCALQQPLKTSNSLKQQHQLYLSRILNLFSFNEGTKIILVVQQTPTFFCLLYILKEIFDNKNIQVSKCINRLFRLVGKTNRQFDFFLLRSNVIDPQDVERLQEFNCKSQEGYWLQLLSKIGEQSQNQWFAILANGSILEGVVQLMNKRKNITISKQDMLQTWRIYEFFSYQQLVSLYFSQEMKQFVGNEQYLIDIWNKNPSFPITQNKQTFKSNGLTKTNIDLKQGCRSYEEILHYNNEIYYQFERWLSTMNIPLPRQKMFCHFWFRNVGVIRPSYSVKKQQFSTNADQQLLALSKKSLIEVLSQCRQAVVNPVLLSKHTYNLNKIQRENKGSTKQRCHSCNKNLQKSQLFGCRLQECGQYFCYLCLYKKFAYLPQQLLKLMEKGDKTQNQLIFCPACQGSCSDACLNCLKNKKKLKSSKQLEQRSRRQYKFVNPKAINKLQSTHKFQFKNRTNNQEIKQQIIAFIGKSIKKDNKQPIVKKEDIDEDTCLPRLKEKVMSSQVKISQ